MEPILEFSGYDEDSRPVFKWLGAARIPAGTQLYALPVLDSRAQPVAAGELPPDKLDEIASNYFAEDWGQERIKNAIHDAFQAARQCADSRPAGGATDRDAALEEAAALCDEICSCCWDNAQDVALSLAEEIRALKSQPAATLAASVAQSGAEVFREMVRKGEDFWPPVAAAVPDAHSLATIAAVQQHLVDVVRSFGDVSCATYISTWHKPEEIAQRIAAAAAAPTTEGAEHE